MRTKRRTADDYQARFHLEAALTTIMFAVVWFGEFEDSDSFHLTVMVFFGVLIRTLYTWHKWDVMS